MPRPSRSVSQIAARAIAGALVACGGGAESTNGTPPAATYTVGGTVSGLTGAGLVLQENGGSPVAVNANGSVTFATRLSPGATYTVTVAAQPTGQTCLVANGSGVIANANVTAVVVTCAANGPVQSSAKDLTAFSFLKSANAIPVDAIATVTGTAISVFLPPGTDRSALKAAFTISDKATAMVGGLAQTSGVTGADFTNPVVYRVKAEDGTTKDYAVTLTTDIAGIDQAVASFMSAYAIPGLSIAITRNENLVYAKAYGKADDTQSATSRSLFRLASVSKQITSIAIMKLLDQGKIALSQTVFGPGAILGTDYGAPPYDLNITNITVDELLHHTAGGWPNDGSDPMFTNPTMTAGQLISWTLSNRPLTNVPGTTYAYSNFGYSVLGRVIEKITGLSYPAAVNVLVLQPLGITDMAIAGNTLADRIPNEVKYYGQSGENPYIYNVARMDAHGGWLATATDLARILVHIDGSSGKPDILSANAIAVMTTASTANSGYACGWAVNSIHNWWHQGSLPGTATEQARTVSQGNYNFVILTNTRSLNVGFSGDLDGLFWTALARVSAWPAYDLF